MRKRTANKRRRGTDRIFDDVLVGRFINCIMYDGMKQKAERIVYDAFDIIKEKLNAEPVEIFKKTIHNCEPSLEVRSRALAIKWILTYTRAKAGKSMAEKLAGELMSAANNEGSAVKKKEDVHRMAEANKAFAHFRW